MKDHPDAWRRLVAAVVESFETPVLEAYDGDEEESLLFTDLRQQFILAGVEHLERFRNPTPWLQIGVAVRDGRQAFELLLGPLHRALRRWRADGRFEHFFFMLKEPGIRLRFAGPDLYRGLRPELIAVLDEELAAGRHLGHGMSVYDAETYQFGGETGLEIAHRLFTVDSLAILDLRAAEVRPQTLPILSLTLLNHLLRELTEDPWEMWDAWCNMRLTHRLPTLRPEGVARAEAGFERFRPALEKAVWRPEEVISELPAAARSVMRSSFEENVAVAERLRRAADEGQLLYGPRKIFPFYVIFQWNRWMIPLAMQRTLTLYMERLLDPKIE
ncbi:MAG: thiopeptide-type bacteriocin biosynthesis protein [Acidobacteriota bacterium]